VHALKPEIAAAAVSCTMRRVTWAEQQGQDSCDSA